MVLFAWMQFLKEETLAYLDIVSPFELRLGSQKKVQRRATQASSSPELDFGGAAAFDLDQEEAVDERAVQDVESLSSLIQEILDFDQAQQIKCFNSKLFLCNICFCEKLGSECMYFLECRHVYCKACLKDYFEIQIRDGQVQCLNCPEPKCPSVATPGQVTLLCAASCPLSLCHQGRHPLSAVLGRAWGQPVLFFPCVPQACCGLPSQLTLQLQL